jgi:hypothetical protein
MAQVVSIRDDWAVCRAGVGWQNLKKIRGDGKEVLS